MAFLLLEGTQASYVHSVSQVNQVIFTTLTSYVQCGGKEISMKTAKAPGV